MRQKLNETEEYLIREIGAQVPMADATFEESKRGIETEFENDSDYRSESVLRQLFAALAVNSGGLIAGSTFSWTSICLSYLEKNPSSPFYPTVEEASWIGGLLDVGALLTAIPSAWAGDKLGRRPAVFICVCAPFLLSWPIAYFSRTIWQMFIARLLAGAGLGGISTLTSMYVGETAGEKARSWLGSIFPLEFCSGILLTLILEALNVSYHQITILLGSLSVLSTLAIWGLAPESPVWYIRKGEREKAIGALKSLGRSVRKDLPRIEHEVASAPPTVNIITIFKRPGYRMRLIACVVMFMFQQLSGINAILFYTVKIFEAANTGLHPVYSSCLVAGIQVVAVIIVAFIIDKTGRRVLLLCSAGITAICHLALGIYFHIQRSDPDSAPGWLPLVSLMSFVLMFGIGFGSVPWVQLHEISPCECAATLSAAAMISNWGTDTLVTKTFGPAAHAWGEHIVFYFYAVINAIGVFSVALIIPETRFKQQHEIFKKYKI